ncbi:MAG: glycoside hydrolase family 18 protein [Chitinophagaceae bacterium]|nr:glycoside hydrolase family 18 protein [Chitinophagaceae bacterium]
MIRQLKIALGIAVLLTACSTKKAAKQGPESENRYAVIGYVAGYKGLIDPGSIDAAKLTHINYAFVDIKDNRAWLHHEKTDTSNFRLLNQLKKINKDLRIMISIGGWSWSKAFSDAVLTEFSRKAFAASAASIIHQHKLDGVDIDWEYPNMRGDGNVFRPEDKQNYTLMFAELRHALDSITKITGRQYQLTTAVGGFAGFLEQTEMAKAQEYLDYVNLMTYDYSWGVAGHHTNLFASTNNPNENSADKAVKDYMSAGVPASKLVVGLAFYGRAGIVESTNGNGLNQKIAGPAKGGGFTFLKDSLIGMNGFTRHWDDKAKAPYLFNETTKHFISYDDEESVKLKCQYVEEKKLGGVMFWEYSSDPKGYLLNVINKTLSAK